MTKKGYDPMPFRARMMLLTARHGVTVQEIADACGVSRSTAHRWRVGSGAVEVVSHRWRLPIEPEDRQWAEEIMNLSQDRREEEIKASL